MKRFARPAVFLLLAMALPGTALSFAEEAAKQASSASLDFANGLYARKMYGPAISEYQKYIVQNPSDSDAASAYFRLADSYYFLKDYAKAVQNFEAFRAKFPEDSRNPTALLRVGTARYFLKNYPGARHALSDIAGTKADDNVRAGALFYLAKTSDAEGKADEAIETLRSLTEDYPSTEYTVYALLFAGDIFTLRQNTSEAVRVYRLVADGTVHPPDGPPPATALEEAMLKTADLCFSVKKFEDARSYYQKAYDLPQRTSLERDLAGLFYSDFYLKDLDAAKRLLPANEDVLRKSAVRFEVNYSLAVLAHEKKDYSFALDRLDLTLNDAAATEDVRAKAASARSYIYAESLRENGKAEEALAAYEEAIKYPAGAYTGPALYQAGFLSAKLKKNDNARKYLSDFTARYPAGDDSQRAALQTLQLDLEDENWDAVVSGAKKFLSDFPESRYTDVALYKLAMGYTGQKDSAQAALVFEKLIGEYHKSVLYPEALYGAASGFDSAGDTQKGIKYYEQFTAGYPAHALYKDSMLRLGFLYVQARQYDKAAQFYEDILLRKPEIPLESSAAFWVIRYDLQHSQYDRMKLILNVLSRRYPDEVLTHEINFFLGESLMGLKNYPEALQYYSKAVEANPEGAYVAYAYLGMGIASEAEGKLDAAESFLAKALGFNDALDVQLRARFEIANIQLKRRNLDEASKAFMHVAILYDDEKYCSAALFKAGECFSRLGNDDEADKVFNELLRRYPKSVWARRADHFMKAKKTAAVTPEAKVKHG